MSYFKSKSGLFLLLVVAMLAGCGGASSSANAPVSSRPKLVALPSPVIKAATSWISDPGVDGRDGNGRVRFIKVGTQCFLEYVVDVANRGDVSSFTLVPMVECSGK